MKKGNKAILPRSVREEDPASFSRMRDRRVPVSMVRVPVGGAIFVAVLTFGASLCLRAPKLLTVTRISADVNWAHRRFKGQDSRQRGTDSGFRS